VAFCTIKTTTRRSNARPIYALKFIASNLVNQ
jgi:hypothetical protein